MVLWAPGMSIHPRNTLVEESILSFPVLNVELGVVLLHFTALMRSLPLALVFLSSFFRAVTSCLSFQLSGRELHAFVLQSTVNLNGDMRSSGISEAVCSFAGRWGEKRAGLRRVNQSI